VGEFQGHNVKSLTERMAEEQRKVPQTEGMQARRGFTSFNFNICNTTRVPRSKAIVDFIVPNYKTVTTRMNDVKIKFFF